MIGTNTGRSVTYDFLLVIIITIIIIIIIIVIIMIIIIINRHFKTLN